MNTENHPIQVVRELATAFPTATFHFKLYRPVKFPEPEQIIASAEVRASELESGVRKLLDNLPSGVELALSSFVDLEYTRCYIPTIDFLTQNPEDAVDIDAKLLLPDAPQAKYTAFKSGTSFHGYFTTLLTQSEWVRYMGRLLLLNVHSRTAVDWRWVGHALNKGYADLRWSGNSERHSFAPRKIREEDYIVATPHPMLSMFPADLRATPLSY